MANVSSYEHIEILQLPECKQTTKNESYPLLKKSASSTATATATIKPKPAVEGTYEST